MQANLPRRSPLFRRLALMYLAVVIVGAGSAVSVFLWGWLRLSLALDAELYDGIASNVGALLESELTTDTPPTEVSDRLRQFGEVNPRVDIYVLDAGGEVVYSTPLQKPVIRPRIAVAPLEQYLRSSVTERRVLVADDPTSASDQTIFSVARASVAGKPGYIYVILQGRSFHNAISAFGEVFIYKMIFAVVGLTLLSLSGVGALLFYGIVRRMNLLTRALGEFAEGNYDVRVKEEGHDEIALHGRVLNQMAETIQTNVRKLEASEKLRRELVANISHDLRSPIAATMAILDTLSRSQFSLSHEESVDFLSRAVKSTNALSRLVDDLFELSKLDAQEASPRLESFPMAELADDVAARFAEIAAHAGVALTLAVEDKDAVAVADIAMIERVLCNLVDNAIKYTPRGSQVEIGIKRENGEIAVRVRDNGHGISAEDLEKIFDRFYRVSKSRSPGSGGAGLGLAIARKILEAHGRTLCAESAPGKGSVFYFTLKAKLAA